MSCQHQHAVKPTDSAVVLPNIQVNGVAISEAELANELQYHAYSNFAQVVQKAGQTLVIRQLLLQELAKLGREISAENEEAEIQSLMSENIKTQEPNEADCRRYFENNQHQFVTTPILEVDHILLAADPQDLTTREVAKNQARMLIENLLQDPLQFAQLAKDFSACPSKENGGNLGQISKGQTVPELERKLLMLNAGLHPSPLESRYGFHVIKVNRKIEGKPLEYAMVADKIRGYLVHRDSHLAIQSYVQSLIEAAQIEGIEMHMDEENIHIA